MKKIFTLLSITLLALTSCSKNDDKSTTVAPSIVGKWIYSKEGSIINGQEVLVDWAHSTGCSKDYLEINADGTGGDNYYISSITPCKKETEPFKWTKNNNLITINDGLETYSQEIIVLTNKELKTKKSNGEIQLFTKE